VETSLETDETSLWVEEAREEATLITPSTGLRAGLSLATSALGIEIREVSRGLEGGFGGFPFPT
jgi:hypothetical protein